MADSNGGNRHTTQVQLGCGTLILIALIVMMFSDRGGVGRNDIEELRDQLTRIEQKLDNLDARVGRLAPP